LLKERYEYLQLRDTSDLRLNNLCPPEDGGYSVTGVAGQAD